MVVIVVGEDEDLKQTMWVVEHLQEELIAADNARMTADEQVQARSHIVQELQVGASFCLLYLSTNIDRFSTVGKMGASIAGSFGVTSKLFHVLT